MMMIMIQVANRAVTVTSQWISTANEEAMRLTAAAPIQMLD